MIKYTLICDQKHEFEGWFGDSVAFESQSQANLVACPICGSSDVRRALMAPYLASPKMRKTDFAKDAAKDIAKDSGNVPPASSAISPDAVPPVSPEMQFGAAQKGAVSPGSGVSAESVQKIHQVMTEMRALQSKIRSECRDVGDNFAEEARKIHYGESDPEGIYGHATPEEREALDDEGIAVVDIPWLPKDN
ncbi:MAG: DUF1178 family protein [Bacteroidetes bacterium]|nr:DUF1178 family protein [Bacteroidota bacterium]